MQQYLQNKKGLVKNVFDLVYDQYDLMNDFMSLGIHRLWKKNLLNMMNPSPNQKLIDVACGTGDVAKLFLNYANKDSQVTCVDPNKGMIKKGKEKLNKFKNLNFFAKNSIIFANISTPSIIAKRNRPSFGLTPNDIPSVIKPKKITSSNGFLTGFRNLTIERAPTIPRDKAILPAIVLVITYVITGSIINETVCACDFAHACPEIVRANLNDKPPNMRMANDVSSSIIITL